MLRLLRVNDPYLLIAIFLVLIVIRSIGAIVGLPVWEIELKWLLLGERLGDGFRMYSEAFDYTGPLAAYTYKMLDWLGGRSRGLHHVLSTILVMFQAGVLNITLLRNKAFSENNYFPAFFYVLAASMIPDAYMLSPQIMSLTFILLSLNYIFRRIDNQVTDELFLYSGLYLGIATLFYLPAIIYFIALLISLLLFSNPAPRRVLLFVYGLLMPFLIVFCYFYWFDDHWFFLHSYFVRGLFGERSFDIGFYNMVIAGSLLFALIMICWFRVIFYGRYANFQSKIQQVMVLMLLAGVGILFIDVELGTHQLILFVPTFSVFIAHYLLLMRRRWVRAIVPYLLVAGLLAFPYWVKDFMSLEDQERVQIIEGEGTLMYLGDDLQAYSEHKIASPFLDAELSAYWIGRLDFYQPAGHLYAVLDKSKPEIILDEKGVIRKIFRRYPHWQSEYRRQGSVYTRKD
ncbi:MAG: hypothetical protein AAGA85_02845 [Bacteroidota bacterium]